MITMFLIGVLSFAGGAYLVKLDKTETPRTEERRPDVWQPREQIDMIRACGLSCGENRLGSYSSLYGKCSCK